MTNQQKMETCQKYMARKQRKNHNLIFQCELKKKKTHTTKKIMKVTEEKHKLDLENLRGEMAKQL